MYWADRADLRVDVALRIGAMRSTVFSGIGDIDSLFRDWGCGVSNIVPFPAVVQGGVPLEHVAQEIIDALGPSVGLEPTRLARSR